MYFNKYPYRANFAFADTFDAASEQLIANGKSFDAKVTSYEGDIFHVQLSHSKIWGPNRNLETLNPPAQAKSSRLTVGEGFALELAGADGPLLKSVLGESFGVSGEASMFQFEVPEETRFFGMGAKNFGTIELSGYRTKFWNTDVWSDFHSAHWHDKPTDPPYFSTPYVAARIGDEWVGFLLHNPYPTFMETPGTDESRVFVEWQRTSGSLTLGSEGGEPNLWIIYGPSLPELTRKLQKLIGVTPTPPLWSLGYHQSRYGYGGHADLTSLDAQFNKHEIPCDALWLDLDYMDGFRVFKTSSEMFPEGTHAVVDKLKESGRRIVPILDPGVKFEKGYSVYDDGHAKDVFCHNSEGREYVGLVWPGETVFPDFTLPKAREWWAGYVKGFAEEGFGATWVDMNDPSTGPVDPNGMRFNKGKDPHVAHHNQFALGMQMATRTGLLKARPDERPFLLSRSGFIGSSKNSAIWTGDNVSNYFYLKISIPTTIGLSLSGLPFNGPDTGGFGDDASEELIVDWFKTGFLFPFFRNHTTKDSRQQEPFAYPIPVMRILRRYIRLRYKLLPYLYNLYVKQEEVGDPILRPLLYSYNDAGLDLVSDQFLVGEDILQAPFVEQVRTRSYVLPGTEPWYDGETGKWVEPGTHTAKNRQADTPLFVRSGAIVPMRPGTPSDNKTDLLAVNFHVFVPPSWSGESESTYVADDGISYGYQSGERSRLSIEIVSVDGNVAILTKQTEDGYGPINATFIIHGDPKSVRLNGSATVSEKAKVTLTGKPLEVQLLKS
jgi:alpha-glucosidase